MSPFRGGYAVDIIRRPRSTGSILKPLLYAAMLEDGALTPRMLLPDVPTHYEGFSPENFDRQYRGAVRADEALAHSLNIPAVRMLKTYGVARFADVLRNAGMTTLTRPADDYGLTLILGGAEGNLWDISAMYASLAAHRARGRSRPGAALPRAHGARRRSPAHARGDTPITPGAAWLTLDALLEVPRPGEEGSWRSFASSRAHRVENRHELRPARRLGHRHHLALHGRRVGRQRQRRRPPRTHRLHHGRAADVRPLQRPARERLVRPSRRYALRAHRRLRERRLSRRRRTARPNAPGCRATATSMRSRLTTCACISMPARRCASTATASPRRP